MLEVPRPLQHRSRAGSSPAQLPPAQTSPSLCHPHQHHPYLQYSSQQELCPSPEQPAEVKKKHRASLCLQQERKGLQSLRKQALPSKSSSGRAGWSWHSEAESSTGLEAARLSLHRAMLLLSSPPRSSRYAPWAPWHAQATQGVPCWSQGKKPQAFPVQISDAWGSEP